MFMARQGDVLIFEAPPGRLYRESLTLQAKNNTKIKQLRNKIKKLLGIRRQVTLAYGEKTGHHHSFRFHDMVSYFRADEGGGGMINVQNRSELTHQEHGPIQVDPGKYLVRQQREYHPEKLTMTVID